MHKNELYYFGSKSQVVDHVAIKKTHQWAEQVRAAQASGQNGT